MPFRKKLVALLLVSSPFYLSACESPGELLLAINSPASALEFRAMEKTPVPLEQYKKDWPQFMPCTIIGNAVASANRLSKKGYSNEDIFWEITPEKITLISQAIFAHYIEVGAKMDTKAANQYTQTCKNQLPEAQVVIDELALGFFNTVDAVYRDYYYNEVGNGMQDRGGGVEGAYNRLIKPVSQHGIAEINNLVAESAIQRMFDKSKSSITSFSALRTYMSFELVSIVVK